MTKIGCSCGKMLALENGGVLYLWCKSCKKEVPFAVVVENGKPVLKHIHEIKK